ncbi:MAG: 4Fe-4S binding protein [Planctomycetota bacterium]|jgi:polyferredoxin
MKEPFLKLAEAPLQSWRRISQFAFLFVLNPLFPRFIPGWTEATMGICIPAMNCWSCPAAIFACPVGAVGQFLARGVFPFLSLGILVLVGSLTGRLVCGWVCPFGLIQDLMFKIPTRRKFRTPHALRWTKYVLLVVTVVAIPLFFGVDGGFDEVAGYFYCRWCPAGTVEASIPVNIQMSVQGTKGWGAMILGYLASVKFWIAMSFLVSFVVWYRPFCKIACPIGAFLGLFNRVSFLTFGHNRGDCKSCFDCQDICPQIPDVVITDNPPECIRCYRCHAAPCRGTGGQVIGGEIPPPVLTEEGVRELTILEDRCKGCGFCIEFCPKKVLTHSGTLNVKGYHPPKITNTGLCLDCDLCELLCPEFAIFKHPASRSGPSGGM